MGFGQMSNQHLLKFLLVNRNHLAHLCVWYQLMVMVSGDSMSKMSNSSFGFLNDLSSAANLFFPLRCMMLTLSIYENGINCFFFPFYRSVSKQSQ